MEDIKRVNEVSLKIIDIINQEVDKRKSSDHQDKEDLSELICGIGQLLNEAKMIKEDAEENGLTVSAIEAEGFLRAMLTVKNLIDPEVISRLNYNYLFD